jgi:ABC-2 type transport system permease protein
MLGYLRLEIARTVRDIRYVVLALAAPVGFYLLFAAIFAGKSGGQARGGGLPASVEIMVAMATFGAMWGHCPRPRRGSPGTGNEAGWMRCG